MALSAVMVDQGQHHAVSSGTVTQGAALGEVAAVGANQLLKVELPFAPKVWNPPGSEDQTWVVFASLDGNITACALDATQFEVGPNGSPVIRLRVDVVALPAAVNAWFEDVYSPAR